MGTWTMSLELPTAHNDAVIFVIMSSLAWVEPDAMIAAGHSTETIETLISAKILDVWELADGKQVYTLTPYCAEHFHVALFEDARDEVPRWRAHDPVLAPWRPPQVKMPRGKNSLRLRYPESIVDPTPGPEFMVDEESGRTVL